MFRVIKNCFSIVVQSHDHLSLYSTTSTKPLVECRKKAKRLIRKHAGHHAYILRHDHNGNLTDIHIEYREKDNL